MKHKRLQHHWAPLTPPAPPHQGFPECRWSCLPTNEAIWYSYFVSSYLQLHRMLTLKGHHTYTQVPLKLLTWTIPDLTLLLRLFGWYQLATYCLLYLKSISCHHPTKYFRKHSCNSSERKTKRVLWLKHLSGSSTLHTNSGFSSSSIHQNCMLDWDWRCTHRSGCWPLSPLALRVSRNSTDTGDFELWLPSNYLSLYIIMVGLREMSGLELTQAKLFHGAWNFPLRWLWVVNLYWDCHQKSYNS